MYIDRVDFLWVGIFNLVFLKIAQSVDSAIVFRHVSANSYKGYCHEEQAH